MLDEKTGNIFFPQISKGLYPGMEKSDFLSSSFKGLIQRDDSHSTASIYVLNPMELWNEKFDVTLIFDQNDKLFMIKISYHADPVMTWANWSEKEQILLKTKHDNLLEQQLGKPPYDYPWGIIGSGYDPRSGSSMITIRYH